MNVVSIVTKHREAIDRATAVVVLSCVIVSEMLSRPTHPMHFASEMVGRNARYLYRVTDKARASLHRTHRVVIWHAAV